VEGDQKDAADDTQPETRAVDAKYQHAETNSAEKQQLRAHLDGIMANVLRPSDNYVRYPTFAQCDPVLKARAVKKLCDALGVSGLTVAEPQRFTTFGLVLQNGSPRTSWTCRTAIA